MKARTAAIGAVLAVLGLAAAVGIGLAANAISDDSVGLSAQPLSAGESLAPKATDQKQEGRRPRRKPERGTQTDGTTTAPPATTTSPAGPQDDHGGETDGGEGSDDGSGSSGSSGSGSSDSDSSGSGSSGSGSSGGSDDNSGHGNADDD